MRCPSCGSENPEQASFCNSCGGSLKSERSGTRPQSRLCVSCGRSIPFDANACPFCGHDFLAKAFPSEPHARISGVQRALFYVLSIIVPLAGIVIGAIYYAKPEPEYKHVGKICLILGIVCIFLVPVALAAVLYVMVLGFGGTSTQSPTTSMAKVIPGPSYGVKYQFIAMSHDTYWSDISIQLSDGTNTVQWQPLTTDLDDGTTAKYVGGSRTLGTLTVWCNITDIVGNGYVNGGDYITFTTGSTNTFSAAEIYTISIIYDPTSSKIYDTTFSG